MTAIRLKEKQQILREMVNFNFLVLRVTMSFSMCCGAKLASVGDDLFASLADV